MRSLSIVMFTTFYPPHSFGGDAIGVQRMARALAARPFLLLLDEVLAGLNPSEIAYMVDIVRKIRDERGVTIIMIEHVMHAVMNVSDRMIVLDYGKQIAEGTPEEVANNEQVIEAYLGDPKLAERLMSEA